MIITVDAAAKINLFLDITSELENGYHSLLMVMQSIGIYDTVTLETTNSGTIEITCSEKALPTDKNNIAYRAAQAFFESTGTHRDGLKIDIKKRIPFAAGLAGGSADAAAVICGLNVIYSTGLCESALCAIGLKTGSDVPFCISGGTKLVENVGEKLQPLPKLSDCFLVVAKPKRGVSTAEAYSDYNTAASQGIIVHPDPKAVSACREGSDIKTISNACANVFEQVVHMPEIDEIKKIMLECSALTARMSGSGPSVFGIFEKEEDARLAAERLEASDCADGVFVTNPVAQSIVIR